jgi:sortase B
VCLVSSAKVLLQLRQYQEGDDVYAQAQALVSLPDFEDVPLADLPDEEVPLASSPLPVQTDEEEEAAPVAEDAPAAVETPAPDPYAEALRNMDFSALQQVNPDVLGWILIPGTRISYPVVQGEDNSFYLDHTWQKSRNSVGAIFLECTNSRDLSDFNTIVYGHRMNNTSMFGILKNYQDADFWAAHPDLYLTDSSGARRYEIFAAYEVSVEGEAYRIGFSSDRAKQTFLDDSLEKSILDTGIVPTVDDQIVTLSTCTGFGHDTRWVVQAVLREISAP